MRSTRIYDPDPTSPETPESLLGSKDKSQEETFLTASCQTTNREGVGHFIPGSPERAMRVAAVPFSMAVVLLADAAPVVDKPQVGDKPPRHPLTAPLGRGGSGGGLRLARTTMRAHDGGLRKGLQGRGEVEKEGKLRARRK